MRPKNAEAQDTQDVPVNPEAQLQVPAIGWRCTTGVADGRLELNEGHWGKENLDCYLVAG
jgi:hypothetical protein